MTRRAFWTLMVVGYLFVFAILGATMLGLAKHPPVPPATNMDCPAHDPANPWCIR